MTKSPGFSSFSSPVSILQYKLPLMSVSVHQSLHIQGRNTLLGQLPSLGISTLGAGPSLRRIGKTFPGLEEILNLHFLLLTKIHSEYLTAFKIPNEK